MWNSTTLHGRAILSLIMGMQRLTGSLLHGRDRELAMILNALARAGRGGPSVIVVESPSGGGRSAVLNEVARQLRAAGTLVFGHSGPLAGDQIRHLTAAAPAVVVWDDPLWTDVEPLCWLAPAGPEAPVWILSRQTPDPATPRVTPEVAVVPLQPLSSAATAELLRDLLGATAGPDVLALAAVAGGNPRRLVELATGLQAARLLRLDDSGAALAPQLRDSLRDALLGQGAVFNDPRTVTAEQDLQGRTPDRTNNPAARAPAGTPDRWDRLNPAERRIARLVNAGLTNKEIGKRIFLAPATVNWHLKNAFRKLQITSRVQLAVVAAAHNDEPNPASEVDLTQARRPAPPST
jgi:DNA-binding CsgD family transcriptional regulator